MTDERQAGLRAWQPYIRHKATCLLNAVRDNPPDDESCTCGLREFWLVQVSVRAVGTEGSGEERAQRERKRENGDVL